MKNHIKECAKEILPIIIFYGIGTLLYAWLGGNEKPDYYIHGWFQFAVGTIVAWSYFMRKQQKEKKK